METCSSHYCALGDTPSVESIASTVGYTAECLRAAERHDHAFHDTCAETPRKVPWNVEVARDMAVQQDLRVVHFTVPVDDDVETFVEIHAAWDEYLVELLRDAGFVHHASVDVWLYRGVGETL